VSSKWADASPGLRACSLSRTPCPEEGAKQKPAPPALETIEMGAKRVQVDDKKII